MILGDFGQDSRPYIEAVVALPRLGFVKDITFLPDTGADVTTLSPADCVDLRYDLLSDEVVIWGVGGSANSYREQAVVAFMDGTQFQFYLETIEIASQTEYNRDQPSLLGRDIMRYWRATFDQSVNRIECEVRYSYGSLAVNLQE